MPTIKPRQNEGSRQSVPTRPRRDLVFVGRTPHHIGPDDQAILKGAIDERSLSGSQLRGVRGPRWPRACTARRATSSARRTSPNALWPTDILSSARTRGILPSLHACARAGACAELRARAGARAELRLRLRSPATASLGRSRADSAPLNYVHAAWSLHAHAAGEGAGATPALA